MKKYFETSILCPIEVDSLWLPCFVSFRGVALVVYERGSVPQRKNVNAECGGRLKLVVPRFLGKPPKKEKSVPREAPKIF